VPGEQRTRYLARCVEHARRGWQVIAGKSLFPVELDWEEIHPGVVAWLHWKVGMPAIWTSLSAMPPEDAEVFLHVLRSDTVVESEHLITEEEAVERQQQQFLRLGLRH
jgi:hypothetical protein